MSEQNRKERSESTQQTVRFFETLLRASTDGIVITDASQNIVRVNEAFGAFLGQRWGDIVETNLFVWLRQLDADAPARWAELEQRVRLEGACSDVEFRIPPRDGTKDGVRYLSVAASLLERVADEETGVIISLWRDITERKRTEETLQANEKRFKDFTDVASDWFWEMDSDLRYTFVSEHYEKIAEKKPEKLLGKTRQEMYAGYIPEERQAWLDFFATLEARRNFRDFTYTYIRPDGQRRILTNHGKAIFDQRGDFLGYRGTGSDITERKQVEEALQESEELYRITLGNISDAVFVTNDTGAFTFICSNVDVIFGYSLPEVEKIGNIAKLLGDCLFDPDELKAWGEIPNIEREICDKAGREHTLLVNVKRVSIKGGTILYTCHDITARKQAEKQVEAALAEKVVLLREIHHRVKNNLQALIYLIDMQAEAIQDPQVLQALGDLQGRARAMSLVHEKLYRAHNLAQVDFGAYLEDLTIQLLHALRRGGDRPVALCVDVEDIFVNVNIAIPCGLIVNELVTNALKYAFPVPLPSGHPPRWGETEGGAEIRVAFELQKDGYVLVVSDNGIGLPPDLDWRKAKSLGLKLVNIWATHQLGGTLELDTRTWPERGHSVPSRRNGTAFTIRFSERE